MDYYVSPTGNDANAGTTKNLPMRTVAAGVSKLGPGDVLFLRQGYYYEYVDISGVGAKGGARIVIQSYPGEVATIDGSIGEFRRTPRQAWSRDLHHAHEWVSQRRYPPGTIYGAFMAGRPSYTRLITYSRIEDFRALNQGFGPLPTTDNVPPGPVSVGTKPKRLPRRPWVYMGPGLFQDTDGRVRIRLSHTTHGLPDIEDYEGWIDPAAMRLAIWGDTVPTVGIRGSHQVTLHHVTLRHGGRRTVKLEESTGIHLDHVTVLAATYGIEIGEGCESTRLLHSVVDGGMPPWYFRSDRKGGYDIASGGSDALGERTHRTLMMCRDSAKDTLVDHCEFLNGHDLQLNGPKTWFTNNWIRNLNDDAVFVGGAITDLHIAHNVFERCLMGLSVASESSAGRVYLYRNLIDLRVPTAGLRPHPRPEVIQDGDDYDPTPMLYGQFFKSNGVDPPIAMFHNTVVVSHKRVQSSTNFFRSYDGKSRRRAFNNIFFSINPDDQSDLPVALLPKPTDDAETDGNSYHRFGRAAHDLLAVEGYTWTDGEHKYDTFPSIQAVRDDPYWGRTKSRYAPGFEASGRDDNPRLRRYWLPLSRHAVEDLRLADGSPVIGAGIGLPPDLSAFDHRPPSGRRPDIGCYAHDAPPMAVGVDGRRRFPGTGLPTPGPIAATSDGLRSN